MKKKFRTVRYEIEEGITGDDKPVTLVHLTDLHGTSYGAGQLPLLKAVAVEHPDLILVTGDMITESRELNEQTVDFLGDLNFYAPVFFCNGNHETRIKERKKLFAAFQNGLLERGVTILENSSVPVTIRDVPMRIYGYEVDLSYYRRFSRKKPTLEDMEEALGSAEKGVFNLLMAHNPMYFEAYKEWGADLTLSGHLHGGYLRLPLLGGIISPQCQLFPKYDRGLFEEKGRYMEVSAGLGNHLWFERVGNPAEFSVVKVY